MEKFFKNSDKGLPRFVLFFEDNNLNNRIVAFRKIFPNIKEETVIEPGFIDKLVHWLNPVNANQTIYIYKI